MRLVPQNDYVVCKHLKATTNNCLFEKETIDMYEILDIDEKTETLFSVGDKIICNSTGTKVDLNGEFFHLFKIENIAGKVD